MIAEQRFVVDPESKAIFIEAIERYKKEREINFYKQKAGFGDRKIPQKRQFGSEVDALDPCIKPEKLLKMSSKEEDNDDVEKKRLASRISSRRTREREKLRLDHFRNAKMQLDIQNKTLKSTNEQLRELIKRIKENQSSLKFNAAALAGRLTNPQARLNLPGLTINQGLATSEANLRVDPGPSSIGDGVIPNPGQMIQHHYHQQQLQQQLQQQQLMLGVLQQATQATYGRGNALPAMSAADQSNLQAQMAAFLAATGQHASRREASSKANLAEGRTQGKKL